jgi:hypothetical protein
MAAFLGGELDGPDEANMKKHIQECPECRRSAEEIERILAGANAVHQDIQKAMETVDWEALPRQIAEAAFGEKERTPKASWIPLLLQAPFRSRWRPVYAGMLAGIIIGAVGMLFILKPQLFRPAPAEKYFASKDFIENVELQLAKRETLDYLEKSRYLILDFIQSPPGRAQLSQKETASQRTQDMLAKKRYLNQQLDKAQLAKAREICNQIEVLFLELSQISDELTAEEAERIKEFIEQKQLLLKINLLKKELRESEV